MRSDLRLRLREITKSLSTSKMGVTGVTGVTGRGGNTLSHLSVTPFGREKRQQKQRVTPVTPVTPRHTLKKAGEEIRHTSPGVTGGVTVGVTTSGVDPGDWLAHYEERAAIREFEGGYDRAEAERLALEETIAALGTGPAVVADRTPGNTHDA